MTPRRDMENPVSDSSEKMARSLSTALVPRQVERGISFGPRGVSTWNRAGMGVSLFL
jgi:hypothetical protein